MVILPFLSMAYTIKNWLVHFDTDAVATFFATHRFSSCIIDQRKCVGVKKHPYNVALV